MPNDGKGKGVGHGPELVQRTRKAVLNTFDAIEKKGKLISEILAEEFEKNPIKFMELAAKLMPKEVTGDFNHTHGVETLTDADLDERINEYDRVIAALEEIERTGTAGLKISKGSETLN